ncbi:hypothetical protein [Geminocystis sp. NIES-3709]|uniref:hypothetical protein n=1 Tax=Geminocystis sp. NIES-3709 TaxID=1617448 RepID=UPI0005FC5844|nr:hypothetical protein [Geminocystis sp. NIES-3709]BAQ67097.1 hypothetical protein GM3709_3862 [Geminocystis sp. NIES-3709]
MLIAEILLKLKQPIPSSILRKKDSFIKGKKGKPITYISWFDTCNLLDERAGLWSWHIDNVIHTETRLIVYGTLTIIAEDKELSMSATGTEELNCSTYGDPSSNAEAMAFKRACAKFGLARYLYDKELRDTYTEQSTLEKPTNVVPMTTVNKTVPESWTRDCGISLQEWKMAKGLR